MSRKATIQFTAEHEAAKMFEEVLKRNGITDYLFGCKDGVAVYHIEGMEQASFLKMKDEIGELIIKLKSEEYDAKPDYAFRLYIGKPTGIELYCNERSIRSLDVHIDEEYGVHNPYIAASNETVPESDDSFPIGSIIIPPSETMESDKSSFTFPDLISLLKIPNGITKIKESAFEKCTSLEFVDLPDSVTEIGAWAFYGCLSLGYVYIPNNVKIGKGALGCCCALSAGTIRELVGRWECLCRERD